MDKQEIIRHIHAFCTDVELNNDCIYLDNIYVCGLRIGDDSITVFYPSNKREKSEEYTGINNYDDIIAVWSEFMHRLKRVRKTLNDTLIQCSF
jgi:hypothetical protein